FDRARALSAELALPLEVIDAEVLLDGAHAVLHHLRFADADVRPFVSTLAREFDLHIQLTDLTRSDVHAEEEAEHGCGSCGSWGQHRLDLPAFFRKAAALGYPAVEVAGKRPHLSPLDYPNGESVAPLREAARAAGARVVTVAGYTDFTAGRHAAEVPFVEMQL